ncbi:unnamed protein product [Spirodela intermedia]|uniref:Uncharacterized protein n=1 Tax=Spirodela intermedia TaxID=51605 RepID=A0A7I8IKZ8_SPIIN|nr:unnamed protein product [Spirodela intermedia]CAA6657812.1 unnamed protein product [Spirodela intermedia]
MSGSNLGFPSIPVSLISLSLSLSLSLSR